MKWIPAIVLSLALAACGGAQGITQRVDNTPAEVIAPLLGASNSAGQLIPGLKVVMSRPNDNEVLYTMPGDGTFDPSTILFRVSPLDDGGATQVEAFVDVPPVTAFVGGKKMILSEAKVTAEVRDILAALAKDSSFSTNSRLSDVLTAVAICTDSKIREQATRLASGSSSAIWGALRDDSFSDSGSASAPDDLAPIEENDPTEFDTPPDASEQFSQDI